MAGENGGYVPAHILWFSSPVSSSQSVEPYAYIQSYLVAYERVSVLLLQLDLLDLAELCAIEMAPS